MRFDKVKFRLHEDISFTLPFRFSELETGEVRWSKLKLVSLVQTSSCSILALHKGFSWDGVSGPIPNRGAYVASAVHDGFYSLLRSGVIPWRYREEADRLFRQLYAGPRWLGWLALQTLLLFGRRALRNPRPIKEA